MCGICGIVDFQAPPSMDVLDAMNRALEHRGPDAGGTCGFGSCTLGHRRLSILDLTDSANQPMLSLDGMTAVVFNGEIYNFIQLRKDLEARGHRFRTRSDTEVLLELYRAKRRAMLGELNGMFSFAVWDQRRQELVLARDRVGKKPLYYFRDGSRLCFSSELNSLLQDPSVPRTISEQSLVEYLLYDFIPGDHTIFQGVHKLPPAHAAVFNAEGFALYRYWRHPAPEEAGNGGQGPDDLGELLSDAVKMRLVSDVPLGSFLSGGIDSTLVTSLMRGGTTGKVKTFSISFPGTSHDESKWARLAADSLGTEHREHAVRYDIRDVFTRLVRHFGEPFGDSSAIPTWHLCRETRKHVTVALSGDGGDELFGGYERYLARRFQILYDKLPLRLRKYAIEPLAHRLPETTDYYGTSPIKKLKLFVKAAARMRENPLAVIPRTFSSAETARLTGVDYRVDADPVLSCAAEWSGLDPVNQMMMTDIETYLAEDILTKVDRMSMAHSLEVRCPLLDYRIVEWACRLPWSSKIHGMTTKSILRRTARGRVPDAILKRSKYGFQVPLGQWFKTDLQPWAEERLMDAPHGYFDARFVENLWKEHQSGRSDHTHRIWLLLFFNEWFEQFAR
ncbi:MAG: asparagine synthase (glutamine-hydrolyzing) [Desulfomonilaceae bacterium]|nr:asparagine synthase (glutamine-hydrolyzing) [Desulfomonilaceae bacterium]